MERKYFIICLVFGIWTFIQTSLHLVGVIYAYFWSVCEQSPTDAHTIFIYLTYLYNSSCRKPKLLNSTLNSTPFQSYVLNVVSGIYTTDANTTNLEVIVKELLAKLDCFPDNAPSFTRTSIFLLSFIILDGTWMVSAVSLIMGTIFGIKQSLSLAFYGPWLVMTICVSTADAIATVLFGFDITSTISLDDWISFVGITESKCESILSNNTQPIFAIPSLVFCSISSRFILIWFSNLIGFILVMKATISVYHETYKNETTNRHFPHSGQSQRTRIDHNTSADRIRNWQLFYGAIDTTTSDHNTSSNSAEDAQTETRSSVGSVVATDASGDYHAYTDVAESIVGAGTGGRRSLDELRGQLPWSYIQPQDDAKGRLSGEEKIEMANRAKRNFRIKSDSSSSGTEL